MFKNSSTGEIDSLESIPELLKSLQIRAHASGQIFKDDVNCFSFTWDICFMTAFLLHASTLYYISISTETLPPTAKTLLICLHLVCTDLLRVKIDEVSLRLTCTMYSIVRTLKDTQSHRLKVHKNENFFGFDFEFCTISLLVMSK